MGDDLEHTGVKGMRWGVRKSRKKSSGKTIGYSYKQGIFKDPTQRLSDKELQAKLNRLRNEREYINLTKEKHAKYYNIVRKLIGTLLVAKKGYDFYQGNQETIKRGLQLVSRKRGLKMVGP